MTKEEYIALALEKYEDLQGLQNSKNFYDYEKDFDKIWRDLGKKVLGKNIGELGDDRRKKKR